MGFKFSEVEGVEIFIVESKSKVSSSICRIPETEWT